MEIASIDPVASDFFSIAAGMSRVIPLGFCYSPIRFFDLPLERSYRRSSWIASIDPLSFLFGFYEYSSSTICIPSIILVYPLDVMSTQRRNPPLGTPLHNERGNRGVFSRIRWLDRSINLATPCEPRHSTLGKLLRLLVWRCFRPKRDDSVSSRRPSLCVDVGCNET